MKTQHPYVHQYLKDILNILSQTISSYFMNTKAKSRKYQGVFEVKSRVKTWQVRGIWSQQLEH